MDEILYGNHCGTCLKSSRLQNWDEIITVRDGDLELEYSIKNMISFAFGPNILDIVPNKDLCENCVNMILEAYLFIQNIRNNHKMLLKNFNIVENKIFVESRDKKIKYVGVIQKRSKYVKETSKNDFKEPLPITPQDNTLNLRSVDGKVNHTSPKTNTIVQNKKIIKEKKAKCLLCDKIFRNLDALLVHLPQCKNNKVYSCELCDYKNTSRSQCKMHFINKHIKKRKLECASCIEVFDTKWQLHHHYQLIHGRTYTSERPNLPAATIDSDTIDKMSEKEDLDTDTPIDCQKCGLHFKNRKLLTTHILTCFNPGFKPNYQSVKNKLQCKHCPKSFITQNSLALHMSQAHLDTVQLSGRTRIYSCQICNRDFATESEVQAHIAKHPKQSKILCRRCNLEFENQSIYNFHVLEKHNSKELIRCRNCTKAFDNNTIKSHICRNSSGIQKKMQSRQVIFKCALCDLLTDSIESLKNHVISTHA